MLQSNQWPIVQIVTPRLQNKSTLQIISVLNCIILLNGTDAVLYLLKIILPLDHRCQHHM